MTVKELQDFLAKFDPRTRVMVPNADSPSSYDLAKAVQHHVTLDNPSQQFFVAGEFSDATGRAGEAHEAVIMIIPARRKIGDEALNLLEMWKVGDRCTLHDEVDDGTVTKVSAEEIEVSFGSGSRGVYDRAWFRLYPDSLGKI